jgi:hypothetical protein
LKSYLALLATILLCISIPSIAHHSDAGYNRESIVVFEAEVLRYEFRNPHVTVFVETEGENGEMVEWEIETGSTPIMQRSGWTPDLLSPGERIIVRAHPERSGTMRAILNTLETADGRLWSQIEKDAEATASAFSLTGVWKGVASKSLNGQFRGVQLTQVGIDAKASYDPISQDPNVQCITNPPPFLNSSTNYLTGIEILEDRVILRNEFLDAVRTVYMDGRQHPQNAERTLQRHSIGHWDGDVLAVDTVLLADFPSGNGGGVPSGSQKHVVERFSLSEDGTRAIVDVVVEDPEFLAEPVIARTEMVYVPHLQLYQYSCKVQ